MYKPRHVPCYDPLEMDHSEDETSRSLFGNGHVWFQDPLQLQLAELNMILDSMTFWQNLLSSSITLIEKWKSSWANDNFSWILAHTVDAHTHLFSYTFDAHTHWRIGVTLCSKFMDLLHQILEVGHVLSKIRGSKPAKNR